MVQFNNNTIILIKDSSNVVVDQIIIENFEHLLQQRIEHYRNKFNHIKYDDNIIRKTRNYWYLY